MARAITRTSDSLWDTQGCRPWLCANVSWVFFKTSRADLVEDLEIHAATSVTGRRCLSQAKGGPGSFRRSHSVDTPYCD